MNNNVELAKALGDVLCKQGKTVTTAESCTGGGIAQTITEVGGASQWFTHGFVTYSNEAKQQLLEVSANTLEEFGAVSEQTVKEMAVGALSKANADIAVSVSGIAGPTGGSVDKPVGLVWFGIAQSTDEEVERKGDKNQHARIDVMSFKCNFTGDRSAVREQAVAVALEKLIQCLVN